MNIGYSKDARKINTANKLKRFVLAWDPDFTKVTPEERKRIDEAEKSGFIPEEEIDWDNLGKYAE